MAKPKSCYYLFDYQLKIDISKLRKWGYLKPYAYNSGSFTWDNFKDEILFEIDMDEEDPHMMLHFVYAGNEVSHRINLTPHVDNFGLGKYWYFVCAQTQKRCRILYSYNGKFVHRDAIPNAFYFGQILSKKDRELIKNYNEIIKVCR